MVLVFVLFVFLVLLAVVVMVDDIAAVTLAAASVFIGQRATGGTAQARADGRTGAATGAPVSSVASAITTPTVTTSSGYDASNAAPSPTVKAAAARSRT